MIGVLLVDDHALLRAGVAQLLATTDDIEVVGEASGGEEAVRLAAERHPDVVLMDLSMPGVDGVAATRRILAAAPGIRVIALTSYAESHWVTAMLDAGACGYLLKHVDPDELIRGIRAATHGGAPLAPMAAGVLLRSRARPDGPAAGLSERELQVLRLLADGLSNRRIGAALGITEATVKVHLTRIFAAIGVDNRTAAALYAHRAGLAGS